MSVFVGVPYSRPMFGGFFRSMLLTEKPAELGYQDIYGYPLDIARNYLVDCYKLADFRYLLYVDNDASFPPGAILRLMEHDLPVVSGCMYTTTVPPRPTMGHYIGQGSDKLHHYRFSAVAKAIMAAAREHGEIKENAVMFPEPRLMEVDGVGMHFTMIRRDVIEALKPPYFLQLPGIQGGEDFYFCRQVKAAGFKIYTDLSIHTGHIVGEREHADLGLREFMTMARYLKEEEMADGDWVMP